MRAYFGTDGIRGRANVFPMTADFALKLGQAAATIFKNKHGKHHRIVIGKDTRLSCYMFESALVAGICSQGVDAILVGVLPTPAISFITRSLRADAGVVISASHNPYYDNGIKFFSANGLKLPDETEHAIEALLDNGEIPCEPGKVGKAYRIDTAVGRYVEFTKNSFDRDIDLSGLKVVLDCANGATYKVAPHTFQELGAETVVMFNEPNGSNINAGCGAVEPALMAEKVASCGAHVGISFDGDGDRVIFSDETGTIVDGDAIMGICARYMRQNGQLNGDTLVATVMSNYGFERSLAREGVKLVRSGVGDRYVLEEMLKGGFNLGGEQSGHIIFSDYNCTGDGLISALQLLKVMVREGKPLSELKAFIETYPQILKNVGVARKIPLGELPETTKCIQSVEEKLADTGRVLVRYSGTEAKLRVMVEGEDASHITAYADEIAACAVKEIESIAGAGV